MGWYSDANGHLLSIVFPEVVLFDEVLALDLDVIFRFSVQAKILELLQDDLHLGKVADDEVVTFDGFLVRAEELLLDQLRIVVKKRLIMLNVARLHAFVVGLIDVSDLLLDQELKNLLLGGHVSDLKRIVASVVASDILGGSRLVVVVLLGLLHHVLAVLRILVSRLSSAFDQ